MRTKVVRVRGLILHNDHILLIRRKKKGSLYYVFPGGHLEEGENDQQGLIREVKEETNLTVEVGRLLRETTNRKGHIVKIYQCSPTGVEQDVLPAVKIIGEELERNSEDNQYDLEWVHIDSFPKKRVKFAGNISIMPDILR
jgi:8-oxo-dGTP pyrophosphatase MutT (NUDIX family)